MASRLIQDNDCHWYIIPCEQVDLFWKWVESMEKDIDTDLDFSGHRVDGPHVVKILDYSLSL